MDGEKRLRSMEEEEEVPQDEKMKYVALNFLRENEELICFLLMKIREKEVKKEWVEESPYSVYCTNTGEFMVQFRGIRLTPLILRNIPRKLFRFHEPLYCARIAHCLENLFRDLTYE